MDFVKLMDFLELIGRLKHEKRTGWLLHNIPNPETVTGHMYRMAMMTFMIEDSPETTNLNRVLCLQLAMVHDLGEAIIGDITPHCGISPSEKRKMEDDAMKKIASLSGEGGKLIYSLYKEYEEQTTPEACFVKDLDRFDMILQAYEYEKRENSPHRLQDFYDTTEGKFQHPFVKKLVNKLYSLRNEYEKSADNKQTDASSTANDVGVDTKDELNLPGNSSELKQSTNDVPVAPNPESSSNNEAICNN